MDYDFITTCNWTQTGTFTLRAYRGSSTNVVTSHTLYYRKKGTSTWNSTTNGEIVIDSTGEWEVANNWNKSGNHVLTHSYYGITAINSCTDVYFNENTLGTTVGNYFLYECWGVCTQLTSMPEGFNLPQGITTVGNDFLSECWKLCTRLTSMPEGFNLPQGITTVGNYFLYSCWTTCAQLTSMPEGFNLPQGIATVGNNFLYYCWYNCTNLTSMPRGFNIPSGITTVGTAFLSQCWNGCTKLKQDGYTEDLVFEFDSTNTFGGSCPIVPDSITGASKESPVRVPVNRPEPPPHYWVGGSGNWSDTSHWSETSGGPGGASVPTSSDDVFIDENSGFEGGGVITIDTMAFVRDFVSASGYEYEIRMGEWSVAEIYGSLELGSGVTITPLGRKDTAEFHFCSDLPGNTITTNDVKLPMVQFLGGGDWTLQDNSNAEGLTYRGGTFYANNHDVTAGTFLFAPDYGFSVTIWMGSGTWEVIGSFGFSEFEIEDRGRPLSFYPETSTIKFSGGSPSIKRFLNWGTGKAFNNFVFTGEGGLSIAGNNTFNNFTLPPNLDFVGFEEFKTQTFSSFNLSGTSEKLIRIISVNDSGTGEGDPSRFSFAGGGTGYEVGDVITDGKTAFQVTEVGGSGNITDCNPMYVGFFYTPQNNIPLTGGHGSGATFDIIEVFGPIEGKHTLSKSSGTVACDYLDLTNSTATGGATWYAGSHSIDDGGNEGWLFEDSVSPSSDERSASISGLVNTSSSRQANITGSINTDSTRSASISGVLMASSSRSAIINGFVNTGVIRNAIISGGTKTFGVRSAVISGSTLAFNIRNAIISGLMTGFGVRSASISGSITLFNTRNATIRGLASSFVVRQASISGSISDTRMASIHGVVVTKLSDEVESTDTLSIVKRLHTLLSDNAQTSDILSITPVRTFSINGIIMPKPHELVTRRTEEGRVHDLLDGSHKWDVTSLYVSHQLTYKIANFNDPRWQELYTIYKAHLKNGDEEGMYVIWDEKFIAGYYYVDISPVDYIRGAGNLATFRLVLTEIL